MRTSVLRPLALVPLLLSTVGPFTSACDGESESSPGPEPEAFTLKFAATLAGAPATCGDDVTGLGPDGAHSVGVSDLRFYVSNLRFVDADGKDVEVVLDENEFQLTHEAGSVALIDLTGNSEGACAASAIAFAEGTARTNAVITGQTFPADVVGISFDVGVPQDLMKSVIAENTLEGAPTPLNEMYWSWASGYRHFVFNFAVTDGADTSGGGYLHLGSADCGPAEGLALEDRDSCGFVNTPAVVIESFDLSNDEVMLDLTPLLSSLDFIAPVYDPETYEVIGETVGAECHSSPMQEDCPDVFAAFGLDLTSGEATAAKNQLFAAE